VTNIERERKKVFAMIMILEKSLATPIFSDPSLVSSGSFHEIASHEVKIMVRSYYLLHVFSGNFWEPCFMNDIRLCMIGMPWDAGTGYLITFQS